MLKKIVIALALAAVVFLVIVALQPAQFRVERSTQIAAPGSTVFAQVEDFHRWNVWSPWAKLDPTMTQTYAGASNGVGSIYSWSGNSKVGEGRMTLLESHPNDLIKIRLEFLKPFAATDVTEFTFKAEGKQTAVTWSLNGENNFMAKAVGLFMNMDKLVGGDFERGLAQLKLVAESAAKP